MNRLNATEPGSCHPPWLCLVTAPFGQERQQYQRSKQRYQGHGGSGEAVGAVVLGIGFPAGDPGLLRGDAHDQPALRRPTGLGRRCGRTGTGAASAYPARAGGLWRLPRRQVRGAPPHRLRHAAAGAGVCQPGLCPERIGTDPLLHHLGAGWLPVRSPPRRPGDQVHPATGAGSLHLPADDAGERRGHGSGVATSPC